METFSALLAICAVHKGQWRGAVMFFFICTRMNGWINNGETGDLRRYRVHYDVIVMNIGRPEVLSRFPIPENDLQMSCSDLTKWQVARLLL